MSTLPEHILRKMDDHNQRWGELPMMPHGIELPAADGDVAELEQLAEIVENAVKFTAEHAPELLPIEWLCHGLIDIGVLDSWPDERIATWHTEREQLLAAWRAES